MTVRTNFYKRPHRRFTAATAMFLAFLCTSAASQDPNLVGLWRAKVQDEEWKLHISNDRTVQAIINQKLIGVGQPNDWIHYTTSRKLGGADKLEMTKPSADGKEGPSMAFFYRFIDQNHLELIQATPGRSVPSVKESRESALVFQRDMGEEIQVNSEVVIFKRTGLMWQVATSERPLTLEEAQSYCARLRIENAADWRLPTRSETLSILDVANFRASLVAQESPLFKPLARPDSGHMFTGTTVPGYKSPYVMNLFNGHIFNGEGYVAYARCVRHS